jgi:hypothetical protein
VAAEGAVTLGQQFPAPFLQTSRVVQQRASPVGTDRESGDRTEHPGGGGDSQHDPDIELALSRQRAGRDERSVTRARYARPHDHDQHEHDGVFGQVHGRPP